MTLKEEFIEALQDLYAPPTTTKLNFPEEYIRDENINLRRRVKELEEELEEANRVFAKAIEDMKETNG